MKGIMKTAVEKLRDYKEQKNMTHPQMAEKIGVPRRTYEDWYYGKKIPHASGQRLIDLLVKKK